MKEVVNEVLKRAGGRKIVLYGCSRMAETLKRMFESSGCPIAFLTDRNYRCFEQAVSPDELLSNEHFPVIVPFGKRTIDSICQDLKMRMGYKDGDWFIWSKEVDRDILYGGVILGKRSQISEALAEYDVSNYISFVGRYTSISHTFRYGKDHPFLLSTSSQIPGVDFNKEVIMLESESGDGKLRIGHDVWIGANTFVNCSKVKQIGNGAVIAAGAVVTEDVPPYAVVAGVPAKIKKYRFLPEQIKILEEIQWWNWNDEKIKSNKDCFLNPDLFFERFKNR